MRKSDIAVMPSFFDRYIHLVKDVELVSALEHYLKYTPDQICTFTDLNDLVYAEGKWTIKDILQHIIDTERIQSYRAMRFARQDATPLPGFDEDKFGITANASKRSLESLVEEQEAVRRSSILLFKNFSDKALHENGICFNVSISVLALGFVIAGHQIHHLNIILERYLPLLKK